MLLDLWESASYWSDWFVSAVLEELLEHCKIRTFVGCLIMAHSSGQPMCVFQWPMPILISREQGSWYNANKTIANENLKLKNIFYTIFIQYSQKKWTYKLSVQKADSNDLPFLLIGPICPKNAKYQADISVYYKSREQKLMKTCMISKMWKEVLCTTKIWKYNKHFVMTLHRL